MGLSRKSPPPARYYILVRSSTCVVANHYSVSFLHSFQIHLHLDLLSESSYLALQVRRWRLLRDIELQCKTSTCRFKGCEVVLSLLLLLECTGPEFREYSTLTKLYVHIYANRGRPARVIIATPFVDINCRLLSSIVEHYSLQCSDDSSFY